MPWRREWSTAIGSIDSSDRGDTYRYSMAGEWQRSSGSTLTKVQAYGIGYDLTLLNNFTFYLDDPVHGDQNEQQDHRFITGVKAFQKRQSRWAGYAVENTYGVQVRNDDVSNLALIHTEHGVPLSTRAQASAIVTTAGVYGENRIEWVPWLRTTAGLRVDGSHYTVDDKLQCDQQRHIVCRDRQPEGNRDAWSLAWHGGLRQCGPRVPQ